MGMRNQKRRRAKKKDRDAWQRSRAATGGLPEDAAGQVPPPPGRSDPRLLPVLAARSDAVDGETNRLFPGAATHQLRTSDWEGLAHGTAAADRAILHGHAEVT